jgi:porin
MIWNSRALRQCVIFLSTLLLTASIAKSQEVQGKPKEGSFTLGFQEQAEIWSNIHGGRRTGVLGNGLLTLSLNADLGQIAGFDGWYLYGSVFQIHGRGISQDLVGNLQPISNIEATRATKLYNLWVMKDFLDGRLNVRIGQEGANDEMMLSSQAQLFLNSSFGYPALLAANLPSGGPNYPIAAPMMRWVWQLSDAFSWSGAIFNGDPAGPGTNDPQIRNRYGIAFRLRDAPLIFNEIWFKPQGLNNSFAPGLWKIGFWYNDDDFADQRYDGIGQKIAVAGTTGKQHKGNLGLYVVADQMIWRRDGTQDEGLGIWGLAMVSPSDRNLIDFFAEGGFTFKGILQSRPNDKAGLAFAYMRTSSSARGYYLDGFENNTGLKTISRFELVTELTYQVVYKDNLSLQPSLQYVVNPSAHLPLTATRQQQLKTKDAVILGARLVTTF